MTLHRIHNASPRLMTGWQCVSRLTLLLRPRRDRSPVADQGLLGLRVRRFPSRTPGIPLRGTTRIRAAPANPYDPSRIQLLLVLGSQFLVRGSLFLVLPHGPFCHCRSGSFGPPCGLAMAGASLGPTLRQLSAAWQFRAGPKRRPPHVPRCGRPPPPGDCPAPPP
jgi:hypothetical protein